MLVEKSIFSLAAKDCFCKIIFVTKEAQVSDKNSSASFDEAWKDVRADDDIQYTAEAVKPPETPQWWLDFLDWLSDFLRPVGEAIGDAWPVLKVILWASLAAGVLFLLWVIIAPLIEDWRDRRPKGLLEEDWHPEENIARKWLEEADALADQGQYEEAAHLLLYRSIEDIERRRPDLLRPSNTTREIERFESLPEKARTMFAVIASHVERGIFAASPIGKEGWSDARNAYGEFALANSWKAAGKQS